MRALDLYAGEGGACLGMQWAGFEVVGIDINPHPNYPGELIIADLSTGQLPVDIHKFDFVWASPPCQKFSVSTLCRPERVESHPDLIPVTREMLKGHPFTVIENVPSAPLRVDVCK